MRNPQLRRSRGNDAIFSNAVAGGSLSRSAIALVIRPATKRVYGYALAHLEIEATQPARAPLPITETGYRSHFERADNIEAAGGPEAFARAWLDHEAGRPAWIEQRETARQGSLF
jgi:hypothetical protein